MLALKHKFMRATKEKWLWQPSRYLFVIIAFDLCGKTWKTLKGYINPVCSQFIYI